MSIYNRNMPQNAIYWPPGSNDGAGSKDFSAIVPVCAKETLVIKAAVAMVIIVLIFFMS